MSIFPFIIRFCVRNRTSSIRDVFRFDENEKFGIKPGRKFCFKFEGVFHPLKSFIGKKRIDTRPRYRSMIRELGSNKKKFFPECFFANLLHHLSRIDSSKLGSRTTGCPRPYVLGRLQGTLSPNIQGEPQFFYDLAFS